MSKFLPGLMLMLVGAVTARGQITITHQGAGAVVNWSVAGTLEVAQDITGPWNDILTTSRQFTVTPGCTHRFYRLRISPPLPSDCLTFTKEHLLPVFWENVHGTDPQHVWMVGNSHRAFGFGVIRFFDGQNWQSQVPHAPGRLNDVFSFSPEVAWAVGDAGLILSTCDSGASWVRQPTPGTASLYGIGAASADLAWAVGAGGTLLKTSDSGQTWAAQTSGVGVALYSVAALSAASAWVVGTAGTILRTDNGGLSWIAQTSGTALRLRDIVSLSASEAWIVGESGTLLHTVDAGQNWQPEPGVTSEWFQSVTRDSAGRLVAVGNHGTIFWRDAGTWKPQSSGTSVGLGGVFAAGPNDVWATAYDGPNSLLRGDPLQNSWTAASESPDFSILWDVHGDFNLDTVWATGSPGTVVQSLDEGRTWRILHSEPDVQLLEIGTVGNHLWAAGFGGPLTSPPGVVLHETGSTWTRHGGLTPSLLGGIAVASPTHVWAVGGNSIIHTPDGGQTWVPQNIPTNIPSGVNLFDVAAASPTDVWAVGTGGVILRTTDGGQTWVSQPSQTFRDLRSISIRSNDLWIVGEAGTILQFDGQTWRNYTGFTSEFLNDVSATDASGVWVVGSNGTLLLFDGLNWTTLPTGESRSLFRVSAVGAGFGINVWVVSWDGLIDPYPDVLRFKCK